MSLETPTSLPQALASSLRRLAHAIHTIYWAQRSTSRLSPTQRKILGLLSSRREGLGVVDVAREIGITAATASDSVRALTSKELVSRQRSTNDRRGVTITLTETGKQLLKQLDQLPDPLLITCNALPTTEQAALYRVAIKMIRGLEEEGVLPASRMCVRCKFFDPFRYAGTQLPHRCQRADVQFAEDELRTDCSIFEAGDPAAQSAL